jgi:hypothetical protein
VNHPDRITKVLDMVFSFYHSYKVKENKKTERKKYHLSITGSVYSRVLLTVVEVAFHPRVVTVFHLLLLVQQR